MDCRVKPGNDGAWVSASLPPFTRIFRKVWRESSKGALFAKPAISLGENGVRSPIMANIGH